MLHHILCHKAEVTKPIRELQVVTEDEAVTTADDDCVRKTHGIRNVPLRECITICVWTVQLVPSFVQWVCQH